VGAQMWVIAMVALVMFVVGCSLAYRCPTREDAEELLTQRPLLHNDSSGLLTTTFLTRLQRASCNTKLL